MLTVIIALLSIRPLLSSFAFPFANLLHSLALGTGLLIWILRRGARSDAAVPLLRPLACFAAGLALSVVFSQNPALSSRELYKYVFGVALLLIVLSLSPEEKGRLVPWILTAGFLASLCAIYQYFFGFKNLLAYINRTGISDPVAMDFINRKRAFLPFVTPNILAGYLAMLIPLALDRPRSSWLVLPFAFALLLTKSIGALLALFVAFGVYYCVQGRRAEKRSLLLYAALVVIIGAVVVMRSTVPKHHIKFMFSAVMRLNYWQEAVSVINTYPLTGVGLGNFNLANSRYAHNSYLQIMAEMGPLGIIGFVWFAVAALRAGLKSLPAVAVLVFLLHNLVDFSFFVPEVSLIWWVIAGLL